MRYLCFILSSKIGDSVLFLIAFLKLSLNCSFFIEDDLFEAIHFLLESFCKVFHFLIFHKSVSVALVFHFFELAFVNSLIFLNFKIFFMNFLS